MRMTDKVHAYPEGFYARSSPSDQTLEQRSATVETLVVAAQAGCHVAFEKLHSLYSGRLYRTILSITRSPQDAEEALQDTFLRAFLAIKTFEGKSGVYTWLTGIAVNSALMVLRKRRSRLEVLFDPQPNDRFETPTFDVKDSAPTPKEIVELSQHQHRTLRAISRLRPYLRTPLRMQVTRGWSIKDGWGLSQTHHGGYAQKARLSGDWLVKIPAPFSTWDAMAIGTAGYTAMLSVLALERGGIIPDRGDILVTGASGGVGSIAIALLSNLGYRVVASTGRLEETNYLHNLGAADVIDRITISEPGKPLARERWAGAVDSVGSHTLANVLSQTQYRGVVTSCGLAQGSDLPATVLPFIMRNVTLAGIDSVSAPQSVRTEAWSRLARDLDLKKLAQTAQMVGLGEVPNVAQRILDGTIRGRTVVDVNL